MSSPTQRITAVKRLYERSLEILDERNLFEAKQELDTRNPNRFNGYVHHMANQDVVDNWHKDLKRVFLKHDLNYLKLKRIMAKRLAEEDDSVSPVIKFGLEIREIEHMIEDERYLDSYALSRKSVQLWPIVNYSDGLIDNGEVMHDFKKSKNDDAVKMLGSLWSYREIISPTGEIIKVGKAKAWSKSISKSIDGGKDTAHAINRAMRLKGINLRVKHPKRSKGVFIQVVQKGT